MEENLDGDSSSHHDLQDSHFKLTDEAVPDNNGDAQNLQYQASEMPGVVVITHDNNSAVISEDDVEPASKRMFLESVSQDGQTYVLTLQNGTEAIQATSVDFDSKLQGGVSQIAVTPQIMESSVNYGLEDNEVNQAWFTSREDKSCPNKGHSWRQGMWSKEETDILQQNINSYCKDHNIVDPAEIIFEMTKDERKDFYRTVAKGLNRPLFSVYRRVIRMYDNKNHVGKYTPEEIEKLRELRIKHGNDWQTIGTALGRSASSIKDRCRLMKDNCNTGKWLPSEERRLADAVYQLSQAKPGEMVTSGISWSAVAEKVGTRSEKQCRTKWLNYLNWKQVGGTVWTREDDINLVCKICSLSVNDENSIDWTEMAKDWPSVRSPQWLRGKWWNIKRLVSDAHLLSFKGICDYLYKNFAQSVKMKPNNPESPLPPGAEAVAQNPLQIPCVSVVHAPNIMTALPVQVKTEVPPSIRTTATNTTEDTTPINTTFQTFEVLPPGVHVTPANNSATFLLTPGQTAIPFATCSQNSSGQIIIHALPAESLHSNENVTVQMSIPSQIIINAGNPHTSALTPLGTTHSLTTPIQLTRPLMQTNASLQLDAAVSAQAGTLLTTAVTGELITSDMASAKANESETDIGSQTDLVSQGLDSEDDDDDDDDDREEEIETHAISSTVDNSQCLTTEASHLILSDPMLSSNTSTDLHTSEDDCHKISDRMDVVQHRNT